MLKASRFKNQLNLVDVDKLENTRIVIIGAGAIGSFFASTIAKMGAQDITVYDDDTIEDHNIANQMYPVHYTGKAKVDALEQVVLAYGEVVIKKMNCRWTEDNAIDEVDIVVAAVDNMDVRKKIWDYYKTKCKFYVEGRMAAQAFRVYGVDPKDLDGVKLYESQLYPQSEALRDRCGEKSIIFTVLQVSAMMVSQVKRFIQNEYRPTETMYDAANDEIIKTYTVKPNFETIEVTDAEEAIVA